MLTNNNFVVSSLLCVSGLILRERAAGFCQPVQSGSSEAGASGYKLWGLPRLHAGAQPGPEQKRPQVHSCMAHRGLMLYGKMLILVVNSRNIFTK